MYLAFSGILDSKLPTYKISDITKIFPNTFSSSFIESSQWIDYENSIGKIYLGEFTLGGLDFAVNDNNHGREIFDPIFARQIFGPTGPELQNPTARIVENVSFLGIGYSNIELSTLFDNAIKAALAVGTLTIVKETMKGAKYPLENWLIWLIITHITYITKASSKQLSDVLSSSLPSIFDPLGNKTLESAWDANSAYNIMGAEWQSSSGSEGFRKALLGQFNIPYSLVDNKVKIASNWLNTPKPKIIESASLTLSASKAMSLLAEIWNIPVPNDASFNDGSFNPLDLSAAGLLTFDLSGTTFYDTILAKIYLNSSKGCLTINAPPFPLEDFSIFDAYKDVSNNKLFLWCDASHNALTAFTPDYVTSKSNPELSNTFTTTGNNIVGTELAVLCIDLSGNGNHEIKGLKSYYDLKVVANESKYTQGVIDIMQWQNFNLSYPNILDGITFGARSEEFRNMADTIISPYFGYKINLENVKQAYHLIKDYGIVLAIMLTPITLSVV